MRSAGNRRHRAFILFVAGLGLVLSAAEAPLAATASADVVLVREGEVVEEDLYATGNSVTINGTIEGDLVFWAFDRLVIEGDIKGDVVGFAPTARITGNVDGSVRLVGADLSIAGRVGGDVFVAGWSATTGGSVGRDVLAWTTSLSVDGSVGRDVIGQVWGPLVISGAVGRDVEMTVDEVSLVGDAYVAEDLGFRSDRAADIGPEAGVGGAIIQREPVSPNVSVSAARMVAYFLATLGFMAAGILLIWVLPGTTQRAVEAIPRVPGRTVGLGLAAVVSPLLVVAAVITIAATAPPELGATIFAVGTPIWLGLTALVLLSVVVAPVPVLIVAGDRMSKGRWSAYASVAILALPLVLILAFVPYVRGLVLVAIVLLGLGGLVRGALEGRSATAWAAGRRAIVESDDVEPPELYAADDESAE